MSAFFRTIKTLLFGTILALSIVVSTASLLNSKMTAKASTPASLTVADGETLATGMLVILDMVDSLNNKFESHVEEEAEFQERYDRQMNWVKESLQSHENLITAYTGALQMSYDSSAFAAVANLVGWQLTDYELCNELISGLAYSYFIDTEKSYCFPAPGFKVADVTIGRKGPNEWNGGSGYYLVQKKVGYRMIPGKSSEAYYYIFATWNRHEDPLPEKFWDGVLGHPNERDELNRMLNLPTYEETIGMMGDYETAIEIWSLAPEEWVLFLGGGYGNAPGLPSITPFRPLNESP